MPVNFASMSSSALRAQQARAVGHRPSKTRAPCLRCPLACASSGDPPPPQTRGDGVRLQRRDILLGSTLTAATVLRLGGDSLAYAKAEEAVYWDGVGRQPHALVTGANTGIGKSISEELARRGWAVTLACRNQAKGEQAAADIVRVTNSDSIDCRILDLASLRSVHDFADSWGEPTQRPIDALINNAGVMAVYPQQFTEDGFELTLGVNHLGHFLLTCLLENQVKAGSVDGSAGGRVITTSSAAHNFAAGGLDFNDLFYERKPYQRWPAYGQSKLANILMMRELDRRCTNTEGCGVTAYSFHPGVVDTELIRYVVGDEAMADMAQNKERSVFVAEKILRLKSPEQGAETGVYLATSKQVPKLHSEYFDNCRLGLANGASKDMEAAAMLWEKSLELTGAPPNSWMA